MELREIIVDLIRSDAKPFTDLLLHEDSEIMWRTPVGWESVGKGVCAREDLIGLIAPLCGDNWEAQLEQGAIDVSRELSNCTIRANVYRTHAKTILCMSIRKHPLAPPKLSDLGFSLRVANWLSYGKGLILVAGATGSGKTTTMASMLDNINAARAAHIVTIEDPIEIRLQPQKSIISQKEVPTDVPSFARGLKDAMRQKPDVLMIGEMRDRETVDTALLAAESGHLVIGSLHATSSDGALAKVLSFFPGDEMKQRAFALSNNLIGVISQVLLPSADASKFVMAPEILFQSPELAKAIMDGPSGIPRIREIMRRPDGVRSVSLNDTLYSFVKEKKVKAGDALRVTYDPVHLQDLISSGGG